MDALHLGADVPDVKGPSQCVVTGTMKHHRVCEWSLCNTIACVPQQKAARMSYSLVGGQLFL